jgi:hypothetical protein
MIIRSLPKDFRKPCSVHRSFIGAMTFNFDMTIWHIAYFSIARVTIIILQYYHLILGEKSYIFEGMLISIGNHTGRSAIND